MFPCKGCLVLPCCSEFCKKIAKRLNNATSDLLNKNICPDCGTYNKFNTSKSIVLYNVTCKYCKHTFGMIATNFTDRKQS